MLNRIYDKELSLFLCKLNKSNITGSFKTFCTIKTILITYSKNPFLMPVNEFKILKWMR